MFNALVDGNMVKFFWHLDESRGSPQSLCLFNAGRTRKMLFKDIYTIVYIIPILYFQFCQVSAKFTLVPTIVECKLRQADNDKQVVVML